MMHAEITVRIHIRRDFIDPREVETALGDALSMLPAASLAFQIDGGDLYADGSREHYPSAPLRFVK